MITERMLLLKLGIERIEDLAVVQCVGQSDSRRGG
jgi:hypothetical protein